MVRVYQLELLITERDGLFTVEPLEVTGQVKASNMNEAIQCLSLCVQGALAMGEPLWREAPKNLLKLWRRQGGRQRDGSVVQRMILKVWGQRKADQKSPN